MIKLSNDARKQLVLSLQRYVEENLDQEIGDLKAGALLDYILKEIGPSVYNQAIADAQTFFQERALDLEAVFNQKELVYWPEEEAARRKKK